jgi:hypothetical protein
VSSSGGTIRWHIYRNNGAGTTSSPAVRHPGLPTTMAPTTTRGGFTGSALINVISASSNVSGVNLIAGTFDAATGNSQVATTTSVTAAPGGGATRLSAYNTLTAGQRVALRIGPIVNGTADFDVVFDLTEPQVEDAANRYDYTGFVNGTRAAQTYTLATPAGTYDLFFVTPNGGVWVDQQTATGTSGISIPVTQAGLGIVSAVYAFPAGVPVTVRDRMLRTSAPAKLVPVVNAQTINGTNYNHMSPGKSYSLQNAVNRQSNVYRFELRYHDFYATETDRERSELQSLTTIPFGQDVWASFALFIPSGQAPAPGQWMVLGQFHQSEDSTDIPGVSPPFAQYFDGGVFSIQTIGTGTNPTTPVGLDAFAKTQYSDANFPRDRWVRIVHKLRFGQNGIGSIQTWIDGAQVVNAPTTPLGFNDAAGPYFKFGVYRKISATDPTTFSVSYANVEVGTTDLSARISSPLPVN